MSTRKSEPGASKREDNPIKRYYAKPTRKNAINAMCSYCMGVTAVEQKNGELDHIEPGFRTYIRNCQCRFKIDPCFHGVPISVMK